MDETVLEINLKCISACALTSCQHLMESLDFSKNFHEESSWFG
jgi:hypothetical protein